MIGRQCLGAFPKQLPRLIGMGEIKVTFAVQPRVLANDLNTYGPQERAIGSFDHLKFRQPFLQVIGG